MSAKRLLAVVVCSWVACWIVGCVTTRPARIAPEADTTVYHEWRVVYEMKTPVDRVVIGFVDHEVSEEKSGVYYILDQDHRRRGFMLPSGTTFAFERHRGELRTVGLGNLGLQRAVKKLLDTRETIALVAVKDAEYPYSTSAAGTPSATAAKRPSAGDGAEEEGEDESEEEEEAEEEEAEEEEAEEEDDF